MDNFFELKLHCRRQVTNMKLKFKWKLETILMLLFVAAVFVTSQVHAERLVSEKYFGTPLGPLIGGPATGQVYIVDETTIFIRQFTLPGASYPLSYFMAGASIGPDGSGFIVPDERSSTRQLGDYNEKDILLRLPEGRTVRDIRWLSIWNRQLHTNLGHVQISPTISVPSPLELPPLTSLAHGVRSGPITVIDAQTILVPDFWYDGAGPAAYWWVSRGERQTPQGLRLKDENGTPNPLRPYNGESFLITFPDTKTIYDFDWFGVYCQEFQVDFGNIRIPQHARVPPSPRMLNIKPETKLNCEVLDDGRGFEMRWIMDGDDIVMQLVARLQPREYMSLGLGKDDGVSAMVGADAAVAWIDNSGNGHAVDYHLGSKEQCVGNRGSCPDMKHEGATDSITLLHAAVINGFSMVTFKRPQLGVDEIYDQHIYSDGQQSILWAIGSLNSRNEVSFHSGLRSYGNRYVDFARTPSWNCPRPDQSLLKQQKWQRLIAAATSTTTSTAGISTTMTNRPPSTISSSSVDPSLGTNTSPSPFSTFSASPTTPTTSTTTTTTSTTNIPVGSTLKTAESSESASIKPWSIPMIKCPRDRKLWAQIGPVGGPQRGYRGITGRQGWGIAWYINGLLIPELVLKRGVTYTFLVEGGNDEGNGARRHPLYLTDSAEGGFEFKEPMERRSERVFGGVGISDNGTILPTAVGRLCEWKVTPATNLNDIDGAYRRFADFQNTLVMSCEQSGKPGIIRFTPDERTPDLLYYQCYTHRYLGWKIHVVDDCVETDANIREPSPNDDDRMLHSAAASAVKPVKAVPPPQMQLAPSGDIDINNNEPSRIELKKRKQNIANNNNSQNKHHHQQQMLHQRQQGPNYTSKPRQPQPQPMLQTQPQKRQSFRSNHHHHPPPQPLPQPQQLVQSLSLANLIPQAYHRPPPPHFTGPQQSGPVYYSQSPMIHPPAQVVSYYTQRPPNYPNNYPSTPVAFHHHTTSLAPAQSQAQPTYQLFPFGPASSLKKFGLYNQQQQQQQQHHHRPRPNHLSSGSNQRHQPKHPNNPNNNNNKQRFQVNPLHYHQSLPPKTLQGGFVPVSIESTNNRIPILGNAKTQNVWFPAKSQQQSKSTANFMQPTTTTTTSSSTTVSSAPIGTSDSSSVTMLANSRPKQHKQKKHPSSASLYYPTKFYNKQSIPTNDIYRIVTNNSTLTALTTLMMMDKPESTTTTLLLTTVSIDGAPATTTSIPDTVNSTVTAPSIDVGSSTTTTTTTTTESPGLINFQNGWIDGDNNGETPGNTAEESQKRFVYTPNGIMSIKDATSLSGNHNGNFGYYDSSNNFNHQDQDQNGKPLSIYSLMENTEKMATMQNNTDHTILSDVLRMIAQNVPISSSIVGPGSNAGSNPTLQQQQQQQHSSSSSSSSSLSPQLSFPNRSQQTRPQQQQSNPIRFRF